MLKPEWLLQKKKKKQSSGNDTFSIKNLTWPDRTIVRAKGCVFENVKKNL